MTDEQIHNEVGWLKDAFPELDDDAVTGALKDIDYMKLFPEDMVESRTSWDELYDIMCNLRRGFSALYYVMRRMAEDKGCEDHED